MTTHDDTTQHCPCACCPQYQELLDWADHLEEVAVGLERDDLFYNDVMAEIILDGWASEYARVGVHNWRQSPAIDEEDNRVAFQMQERGETIPDDFFQEDLSGYFYDYPHFWSLTKSVNTSARADMITAFRDKAAAAREVGQAGMDYCAGNPPYVGRDSGNTILDYFCLREPEMINQNVWNALYATGMISYATWEDATNEVLEDFLFKAAIVTGVGSILIASRSILRNVFRAGVTGVRRMSLRQFARLSLLARKQLTTARILLTTRRVYRVEGSGNAMLHITPSGQVLFINEGRTFFLNGGVRSRALEFQAQRIRQGFADTTIRSFRIPRSFLRELDETALSDRQLGIIRQTGTPAEIAAANARPQLVDPTKAPRQFGLRHSQIKALQEVIIDGSGLVE